MHGVFIECFARLIGVGLDACNRNMRKAALRRRRHVRRRRIAEQRTKAAAEAALLAHFTTSFASDIYACAPRDFTSKSTAGLPYDGASDNRMLRGICVANTRSGK